MKKTRFILNAIAGLVLTLSCASLAQAQFLRSWVSGVGDDAFPCSRTAPCKTFAGAVPKTTVNGEINVLDSGNYGTVSLTKSITIDGNGHQAGILATGVTGVTVNLTSTLANDPVSTVRLRNLSINGTGSCGLNCGTRTGIRGINVSTANTRAVNLIVENVVIDGFLNEGILFNPPNGGSLIVRNSSIINNAGAGISISASIDTAKARLENVNSSLNNHGLLVSESSRVTATSCTFSHNITNGVFSDATSGFATIRVWNSDVSLNGANGVRAGDLGGGSSGVEIGLSQINNNTGSGVLIGAGGLVETFSNNSIRGNGTDGCTGCTVVGPGS